MCGRFTHMYTWKQLHRLLSLNSAPVAEPDPALFEPSYNVAPTQLAPVVRRDDAGVRYLSPLRWGLVPQWADDFGIGSRLINARSEEAAGKPAFRAAAKLRRCLVPVSGFYEWQALPNSKAKQPWYFTMADESPFLFAGLWERWDKSDPGTPVETFTILTGEPNALLAPMHNRMPCILAPEQIEEWLDPAVTDFASLAPLLEPFPPEQMAKRAVSTRVNSPRINDASLLEASALVSSHAPEAQPPDTQGSLF